MSSIPLAFDTTPLHTVACNHPSSEPQENEPWEPGAKKPEKLARGSVAASPLLELDELANRAEEGHDPGRRWSAINVWEVPPSARNLKSRQNVPF